MIFKVRTGFSKQHQCEEFAVVKLSAQQAQELIQSQLIKGCSYDFGASFANRYKGKAIPPRRSPYIKRKCSTHR